MYYISLTEVFTSLEFSNCFSIIFRVKRSQSSSDPRMLEEENHAEISELTYPERLSTPSIYLCRLEKAIFRCWTPSTTIPVSIKTVPKLR